MVDMAESYIKMIGSNRGRRGIRGLWDMSQAGLASVSGNPWGAQDYFVDGNRSTTSGDGKSWDTAFQSLSEAITASNITIAAGANRWWARRNRIFACGDQELTENLTILPEKCDIIGVGFDIEPQPRVTGHHIIAALATGKAYGTRFFNMGFMNDAANEIFKFVKDHMAIEFYGCNFWPFLGGSTIAVSLTDDNRAFKMYNSRILQHAGDGSLFASGISIAGNGQHDMVIAGNFIRATEGITIAAATGGYNGQIVDNIIHATVLTVNDDSDLWYVIDNRLITDVDTDGGFAGGIDCKQEYACGNIVTGSGTEGNADTFPWTRIAA